MIIFTCYSSCTFRLLYNNFSSASAWVTSRRNEPEQTPYQGGLKSPSEPQFLSFTEDRAMTIAPGCHPFEAPLPCPLVLRQYAATCSLRRHHRRPLHYSHRHH